jgi:uncharacterized protein YydD (DUF2326 family)
MDEDCSVQHERELREAWQKASDEKVLLVQQDLVRRLEDMNQFRRQITEERSDFMRREVYDREMGPLQDRVKRLEIAAGEAAGKTAAYASIATIIIVAIEVALHFWK